MAMYDPVNIVYKAFNPENGTDENLSPIIFMHGLTGSKEFWNDVPQKIADRTKRKAYAIDARNHGYSEYTDSYNFDMNVDDLFHFMDKMNIPKAILTGHSIGGLTATNAALKNPKRIDLIISEDMFVKKLPQQHLDRIYSFMESVVQSVRSLSSSLEEKEILIHVADIMADKVPEEYKPFFKKEEVYKLSYTFRKTSDGHYDIKFNSETILQALKNAETLMTDPIGQFDKPAYFLYGELSPFAVGSEGDNIRKHFPKAQFIEFKGASHNLHEDFPEKYIDTVVECLQ